MLEEEMRAAHILEEPIRHTFSIFKRIPNLVHGVFTRDGGTSQPPFATLNVAWNIGDSQDAVRKNLLRVTNSLGLNMMIASPQVHGDTIHRIDEDAIERAEARPPFLIAPPGDALVTRLRGVGLLIKIADCQAIFLVDPVREVIANIHCGWRGSVTNLPGKTVLYLQERFGSRPEDLLAAVSPSLGPCHAEFRNYRDELPPSFWSFQTRPQHFDFWAISRWQLAEAGLRPENIEVAGRCTVCDPLHFFSYRGEHRTGRMAAVLAWKKGSLE